jgi:signal transduction histidine kinase
MSGQPVQQRLGWYRRARRALAYSLRVRLTGLFVLLAVAMCITFLYGMQRALAMGWRDAARPLVVDYVDRLATELGSPPDIARAQAIVERLPISLHISGPQVNWRSNPDEPDFKAEWQAANPQDSRWEPEGQRLFERTTADGHRIQFGLSVLGWHDRPRLIGRTTLGVLLLLIAIAYAGVHRMLRPLGDIRAGAKRFGAGEFAQAIPVRPTRQPDELGELATTINTMAADIHQMLEAKRSLLLAISHELRSPLTRARLNTELLPETADVQPGRQALLRDLAVMRDLVTDLLESERLANPHAALHREPVDWAELLKEVVASLQATHPQAEHIAIDLAPTLLAQPLDRTRIRLMVRNLLDNALRHSGDGVTAPRITVQVVPDGACIITVRDFGPGVPEGQISQLGQAFYRPDAARTRDGGGVGLGLYLCRLVAQAHGGTLQIRNAQPGLELRVELPVQVA